MCLVEREHHQIRWNEGKKVGEMRYVTKLRDSELSIRWIDRSEIERYIYEYKIKVTLCCLEL